MTADSYEAVQIERHGPVARLVMNRPDALNSFNGALRRDMLTAVTALDAATDVRVVVLAGAGRAFCAGADLAENLGSGAAGGVATERMLNSEYKPSVMGIAQSPKLWIAEVQGAAAGIGSAYAMACDLMVMAEEGYLYQAFAAIGLIPDGGATWQLLRALGRKRAMEVIIGGERLYATRCLELGLCNRVVAAQELTAQTLAWAAQLANKAPLAVQYSKRALAMADGVALEEMISAEATMQHILIETDDCREGVTAFFEKREPQFRGR
jgi:2-(1,2-epoxy-1,2-dihydrophenyl)acetyl-CoA isomerase